jgi:hypothetical protein
MPDASAAGPPRRRRHEAGHGETVDPDLGDRPRQVDGRPRKHLDLPGGHHDAALTGLGRHRERHVRGTRGVQHRGHATREPLPVAEEGAVDSEADRDLARSDPGTQPVVLVEQAGDRGREQRTRHERVRRGLERDRLVEHAAVAATHGAGQGDRGEAHLGGPGTPRGQRPGSTLGVVLGSAHGVDGAETLGPLAHRGGELGVVVADADRHTAS